MLQLLSKDAERMFRTHDAVVEYGAVSAGDIYLKGANMDFPRTNGPTTSAR